MKFNEFDLESGPKRLDLNQDEFYLTLMVDGMWFNCGCCLPLEKLAL